MPDRPPWIEGLIAPAKAILAISNDDPRKIVGVAVVLCLACSTIRITIIGNIGQNIIRIRQGFKIRNRVMNPRRVLTVLALGGTVLHNTIGNCRTARV